MSDITPLLIRGIAREVAGQSLVAGMLLLDLPEGTTKEVVESAMLKMRDASTALVHEARALERFAEAEEDTCE